MKIGILCIATGNYKSFVQQLIDGIEKNFLVNHEREIYLFTDEEREYKSGLKIIQTIIPSYKWPEATMMRYHIFTAREYDCDYLVYSDVDMGFVDKIGDEFLGNIIVVRHPGFINGKENNSWEENELSQCYIPKKNRGFYYAGGIQGGNTGEYYTAMSVMKGWIDADISNGVIPIWHDETAWNKYISLRPPLTELDCSYCMPQSSLKRIKWGINHIKPKILCLEKNFKLIRS